MTTNTSRARVDALLDQVLDLETVERPTFLGARCGNDLELRMAVDELLRLAEHPGPVLQPGSLAGHLLEAALIDGGGGAADLDPDTRLGRWRVVREVGRGGMGAVYLVERADGQYEQRGALKLVRAPAGSDEIAQRLQRERRILASLSHTGIAKLLDGGQTDDGRPFLVMEFVEGDAIDRACDQRQLPVDERLELFLRVCDAVQYAHRRLVVHRDIKPTNIVVTRDGDVKLLDFGIARLLSPPDEQNDEPLTRPAMRLLTPEYASPEQVRGEPVAIASDVYQLGLLLYELLTGCRAQSTCESTPAALAHVVCEVVPVRPSIRAASDASAARARGTTPAALARTLRSDLDNIVLCALRKEPDRRYAAVDDLMADVRRYRAGLPVHAHADSIGYRARKFVGRHRAAMTSATVLLISATVLIPTVVMERWRASREAARSEHVETLVRELFALPNPRVVPQPPTAVQYLDHAARHVRGELIGQPRSQARLLTMIGRVYNALGRYQTSIDVLDQALNLRRTEFGRDSLEVADTLEWLGQSHHYSGRYDRAEDAVREALGIRRRRLGLGDPDTIRVTLELGDLLHTRGQLVEAEGVLREAVGTLNSEPVVARAEDFGHDSLPRAMRDLANVLRDRGSLDESAQFFQRAIETFRRLHGEPNQQVLTSEIYYSRLLIMRSEFAEAERLLVRAVPAL